MASLVKDSKSRSPYWIACYTSSDGRRLKKSTKETIRAKALEMALVLERAERLAGQDALTQTRARDLLGQVLERTTGERLPFYSAESWLRDWLRGKEVSKSTGTHVKYASTIEGFLKHLGKRSKLNISAITALDVASYRDAQTASGKHPNTVYYLVKQLRIPFNAARRQGILTHNPGEAVELPSKPKAEDGGEATRDVFTIEQIKALIDAAIEKDKSGKMLLEAGMEWRGAILLAYYTGARLQDVANMTWSCVDLAGKSLTYRVKKTGRLIMIPTHPDLEACLMELPTSDNAKAFLFPNLSGKGTGGRSGLSMAFSRIMARAGVVGSVLRSAKKGGKGRTVRSLTFHSLRHSFNSAMANAGVSQEVRMKLTGHTSTEMNRGYTHHELEPLRVAVGKVPSVGAQENA